MGSTSPRAGLRARIERWRVPVLVGSVGAVLAGFFGQALAVREQHQFDLLLKASARDVRAEIRAGFSNRMNALSILAREWEGRILPIRGAWESDVRLVLAQSPGLETVAWMEPSGRRSWAYPPEAALPPLDLAPLREEGTLFDRPVVAGLAPAPDGEPRLRILAPMGPSQRDAGWLLATFRTRELLADMLSNIESSYGVSVIADGLELHRASASGPEPHQAHWVELRLPGAMQLRIGVEPSDEMLQAAHSYLPNAVLAGGLGMSLLLATALGLRNVASQRARELELRIEEHERAREEIRRLNAELEDRVRERTEELTRSNQDLERFASFLSHELRQPLGTQALWIELLESESGGSLGDDGRRYLAKLREGTGRMSELITAQLALSSATAGIHGAPVELGAVVEEVIGDLSPELDSIGAKVLVGTLPTIEGDRRQLYQLFRNLLENSLKYRRPDAACEVTFAEERVDARGERVGILVRDNGRGFSAAQAERIFAPNERLDAVSDGYGLGLALCRSIVERHGGSLVAEGMPGVGACFRIVLPREQPAPQGGDSA